MARFFPLARAFAAALFSFVVLANTPAAIAAPSHGIAMHGAPKYPAGFSHFDYVNPDAPTNMNAENPDTKSEIIDNPQGMYPPPLK